MRKKTFKNCLKLGLVFFCTLIFLSSCQNEEQILEEQTAEEQINDFEQTLLKKNKLKNNQAVIEAAKNWFKQNPNENNFTALEHLEEIDWNNAFVTFNNNTYAVEVPIYFKKDFNLIPLQKKKGKNYLKKEKTFSRLLFLPSNNSEKPFSSYLTNFYLDNSKTLEKLFSSVNYFHIHNSFKGKIAIIDANNNLKEFKDTAKKTKKQQYLSKLAPMEVTCVWWGWWYEDGHFEEISLVGCSSGSDYNPETYGVYSNYGGGGSSGNGNPKDSEPLPLEPDQIIDTNLTGKEGCINDLLDETGNSYIKNILNKFDGKSEFDIKIESQARVYNKNGDEVNGLTKSPIDNVITIQINSYQMETNKALEVARTILHEYIHADMYRKLLTENPTNDELDFRTTYEKFESDNFEASFQHETMADLYVGEMTNALKNFHENALVGDYNWLTNNGTNPLPNSFYEALAWQGLKDQGVKAYTDLSDSKKEELKNSLEFHYPTITPNCPNN
ncbi:hypothetical protein [Lutibacter sp. HS1-25]|uniref:hypothetical protein n=1 Tax=Lutibacter sp. HS1-25 TaxID=2485000 RepID=UPI001012F70E|nr:hypothetical protein [Lutibacter sp. HS1-25]